MLLISWKMLSRCSEASRGASPALQLKSHSHSEGVWFANQDPSLLPMKLSEGVHPQRLHQSFTVCSHKKWGEKTLDKHSHRHKHTHPSKLGASDISLHTHILTFLAITLPLTTVGNIFRLIWIPLEWLIVVVLYNPWYYWTTIVSFTDVKDVCPYVTEVGSAKPEVENEIGRASCRERV